MITQDNIGIAFIKEVKTIIGIIRGVKKAGWFILWSQRLKNGDNGCTRYWGAKLVARVFYNVWDKCIKQNYHIRMDSLEHHGGLHHPQSSNMKWWRASQRICVTSLRVCNPYWLGVSIWNSLVPVIIGTRRLKYQPPKTI